MHEFYLEQIKSFEGYAAEAKWDFAQHSVGFGTKARFPGERISQEEADQRFRSEIAAARAFVEKHAGQCDEGTKAALTSLTFNSGTRWTGSGLGDAVRAGDIGQIRERFVLYNRAGGEVLPGLVKRRLAESAWIGASQYGDSATDALAYSPSSSPVLPSTVSMPSSEPFLAASTASRITSIGREGRFTAPISPIALDTTQVPAPYEKPAGETTVQMASSERHTISSLSLHALLGILLDIDGRGNREDPSDNDRVA